LCGAAQPLNRQRRLISRLPLPKLHLLTGVVATGADFDENPAAHE
jgi:hypothetical protein